MSLQSSRFLLRIHQQLHLVYLSTFGWTDQQVGACPTAGGQMDQVVSGVTGVFLTGAQAPSITVGDKPVRKSVS